MTSTGAASSTNAALVERYFELLNAERWAELAELFTDDGVAILGGVPSQGREAIERRYGATVPSTFPRHVARVTAVLADERVGFGYVQVDVTRPDGVERVVHAVDVFEFRDGRIASLRVVYDRAAASA
jgi:ketosteroid isomerase-like protein